MEQVSTQPNIPSPMVQYPQLQPTPKSAFSKPLLIIIGTIIFFALLWGAYFLGTKQSTTGIVQKAPTPATTETTETAPIVVASGSSVAAPSLNFQTYTGSTFTISYPKDWSGREGYNFPGDFTMYDPSSLQAQQGNGGAVSTLPTKFVAVVSVISSSDTPAIYANKKIANNPAYNANWKVDTIMVGSYSGVIYQESGEGSMGYDVIVSNGQKIAVINISTPTISTDSTIKNILATFKFF